MDNCHGILILAGTTFPPSVLFCFSAVEMVGYGSFTMVVLFVPVVVGANSLPSATAFQRRLCGFSGARCSELTPTPTMAAETTNHLVFRFFSDISMGFLTQKDTLFCVKSDAVVTGLPTSLPCAATQPANVARQLHLPADAVEVWPESSANFLIRNLCQLSMCHALGK